MVTRKALFLAAAYFTAAVVNSGEVQASAVVPTDSPLGSLHDVVSLDGTWQAEVAQDAQWDVIPAAFTRTIPVPAKWRVTPALPARTRYIFVEISDISPTSSPPLRILRSIEHAQTDFAVAVVRPRQ